MVVECSQQLVEDRSGYHLLTGHHLVFVLYV